MSDLLLVVIGVVVGAIGTLVGAGGGFLLVPIFLFLHPDERPEIVVTISLAIVLINALSGSYAYARQGRIDVRLGLVLAVATVPGAVAGALVVDRIARGPFTVLFSLVLLGVAALLAFRPAPVLRERPPRRWDWPRRVVDREGTSHAYNFPLPLAFTLSLGIGFLSSLLGIGGGIIQVPLFILLLRVPTHIATATSTFMLVIMSLSGTLTHILAGDFGEAARPVLFLAPGVIAGAQLGAWLSRRIKAKAIARILAAAMALAAIRLLAAQLT